MRARVAFIALFILLPLIALACQPTPTVTSGNLIRTDDFSSASDWQQFSANAVHLKQENGAFLIETNAEGFVWSINSVYHTDVILEVESRRQVDSHNNAHGVMCRAQASNNGDGYYFLISGDGYYSIAKGVGDSLMPLVDWEYASVIQTGANANKLKAVCVGDYLAFYVNGQLLAETRDSGYPSGYAGLSATGFEQENVRVAFDNLNIAEARVEQNGTLPVAEASE